MNAARPASAALLSVPVREHCPFLPMRSMFGVRKSHNAVIVGADVEPADVIAKDNQDVRFFGPLKRLSFTIQFLLRSGKSAGSVLLRSFVDNVDP
jgi:hypothetical protein